MKISLYIKFTKHKSMSENDKELKKFMRRVLKKQPKAKLTTDLNGRYFISVDGEDITEEYFMPHSATEVEAWKNADLSIKTTQNFNRSHPLKADMADIEKKTKRINKRKMKGVVNKERAQARDNYGSYF